jgi:HrpA-like RNA helicase
MSKSWKEMLADQPNISKEKFVALPVSSSTATLTTPSLMAWDAVVKHAASSTAQTPAGSAHKTKSRMTSKSAATAAAASVAAVVATTRKSETVVDTAAATIAATVAAAAMTTSAKNRSCVNDRNDTEQDDENASSPKTPLSPIYNTDIPSKLKEFCNFDKNNSKVVVLHAYTGAGKSSASARMMAHASEQIASTHQGNRPLCSIAMPTRVAITAGCAFAKKMGTGYDDGRHSYAYSIGGESNGPANAHVRFVTYGWFAERFLNLRRGKWEEDPYQIIMLDEIHDSSDDTEFVLNLMLYYVTTHENTKLIISSATLDVQRILKICPGLSCQTLSMPNTTANTVTTYLNPADKVSFLDPLTGEVNYDWLNSLIIQKLSYFISSKLPGHILVMMPGQDEIDNLMREMEKQRALFNGYSIFPLFSGLTRDEINDAIYNEDRPKIILATNIVESAITIKNLNGGVDSGLRKEIYTDENGISELRTVPASKTNMIQTAGRLGRDNEGPPGQFHPLMTQDEFNSRSEFSRLESERNPVYRRLVRCIKFNLPFERMFLGISQQKIQRDLRFLIENNIIVRSSSGELSVTEYGESILKLSCSIPTAKFVVHMMEKIMKEKKHVSYFYYMLIAAAWIEQTPNPFYRPKRGFHEDAASYANKMDHINTVHQQLIKDDCLETFINIWDSYYEEDDWKRWARDNFIYEKAIFELDKGKNDLLRSFQMNFSSVRLPWDAFRKNTFAVPEQINQTEIITFIKRGMSEVYRQNAFAHSPDYRIRGIPYKHMFRQDGVFILDKFIKNKMVLPTSPLPATVLAFGLRRRGHIVFMNCVVDIANFVSRSSNDNKYDDDSDGDGDGDDYEY